MKLRGLVKWLGLCALTVVIGACSSTGPRTGFAESDDFEPMSRAFLDGNRRLDFYVLRPAAEGYDLLLANWCTGRAVQIFADLCTLGATEVFNA